MSKGQEISGTISDLFRSVGCVRRYFIEISMTDNDAKKKIERLHEGLTLVKLIELSSFFDEKEKEKKGQPS